MITIEPGAPVSSRIQQEAPSSLNVGGGRGVPGAVQPRNCNVVRGTGQGDREVAAAFIRGTKEKHVIWGWLQVGDMYDLSDVGDSPDGLRFATHHPHVEYRRSASYRPNNCIYEGSASLVLNAAPLSFEGVAGAGIYAKYDQARCLTTPDANGPSFWSLPAFIREAGMTHHPNIGEWELNGNSIRGISVGRGQEYVINTQNHKEQSMIWLESIFKHASRAQRASFQRPPNYSTFSN